MNINETLAKYFEDPDQNKPLGDSSDNYNIAIQNNMIIFKVKSETDINQITQKIECLNDPNIRIVLNNDVGE